MVSRLRVLPLLLASPLALVAPICPSSSPDLVVHGYVLERNVRLSRTLSEYTYGAAVRNQGDPARHVRARLTTTAPGLTVLDGRLGFGDVATATARSACDTFTVRHDRNFAFDESAFVWNVEAAPPNAAPVADAGPDQAVAVGAEVTLDGSGSTDADGDVLAYTWSLVSTPAGSAAALSDPASARPTFTVDQAGDFVFELGVSDGDLSSSAQVTVTTGNAAPRAAAGPDQTVAVGALAYLDGFTSSDPNGDALGFAWELVSRPPGSAAALADPSAPAPTFDVDLAGRYVLRLVVDDGALASAPDEVVIDTDDSAPIAVIGSVRAYQVGDRVVLDGEDSRDPDGARLVYRWSLLARPAASVAQLDNPASESPRLIPDAAGVYVAQLVVSDGCLESEPVTVAIEVAPRPDSDGDGLFDDEEYAYETDPYDPDTDGDGLSDGDEVHVYGTNPTLADSDADGFTDGQEISFGTDPNDPADTPAPPPTVVVDPSVQPVMAELEDAESGGTRPLVAMTDHSGRALSFVANELLVASDDTAAVEALAQRFGGAIEHTVDLKSVGVTAPAVHRVRIDPATVDPSALVADLARVAPGVTGELRLSSEDALRLFAAAANANGPGMSVGLNAVLLPQAVETRSTTEGPSIANVCPGPLPPPNAAGCVVNPAFCVPSAIAGTETFNTDAFQWSYMGFGGVQNIGGAEAWRLLKLADKLGNRVRIAVIDGGFSDTTDNPTDWEHYNNSISVSGFPANPLTCTNGASCPWHGTNVVSVLMGGVDDGLAAAGVAGQIARAVTIRYSGDIFNVLGAYGIAISSGARVINMSIGARIPALASWTAAPIAAVTNAAREGGIFFAAAAGNDAFDVDSEDCAPPLDWPCWEDALFVPCELGGVTCVGALADNSTRRRSSSNYGSGDVDLFGPGNLWVGDDPCDAEPHLFGATSAATPFVSGVAALAFAANPSLTGEQVEQILIDTANPSSDGQVRRYVNAYAATLKALSGQVTCSPPEFAILPQSRLSAPCIENRFSVTMRTDGPYFGPFTYLWRKWVGSEPVPLTDDGHYSGTRTSELVIPALRAADVASYDVVVTNPCGTTVSPRAAVQAVDGGFQEVGSLPDERAGQAMAFDVRRGRMVAFGGESPLVTGNVVTSYRIRETTLERDETGTWSIAATGGPPARSRAAMAYDEARGVMVLFGGGLCDSSVCNPGNPGGFLYYGDTWEWDGTTWTERTPAFSPTPRIRHAMTWDPVRQRVVMFGGQSANGVQADLWEWDGTTWTNVAPAPDPAYGVPAPRSEHGLAFDRARNMLVLHGGDVGGTTWELAGSQWAFRYQAPALPLGHGLRLGGPYRMTYDTDRNRMLMVSARDSAGILETQLWEWTGADWIEKFTLPWRYDEAVAYDPVRHRTVIAGGLTDATPTEPETPLYALLEVWEWRFFDFDPVCTGSP